MAPSATVTGGLYWLLVPAGGCELYIDFFLNFLRFGSLIRSRKSGVIFNDEMDDFSYPTRNNPDTYKQTEINFIEPGKRPLSSTTPTIILDDEGKVKMVVGASGGFRITTAVAQVKTEKLD